MTRACWFVAVCAALAAPLVLLAVAGCERQSGLPPKGAQTPIVAVSSVDYAGNEACAGCHAEAFRQHQGSRHNFTLRALDLKLLGKLAPPLGPVPDSDIVLLQQAGAYRITKSSAPGSSAPVQIVFGSGKTGMTFAAVQDSGGMVEISRSYFPSRKLWYVTPGHEARPKGEVGLRCTPKESMRCMRCHSVTLTEGSAVPEPRFRGVGCEACHGPARAHVEAMRAGQNSDLKIARLGALGAERSIKVCAACHRGKEAVNLQSEQAHMTNRFQAYGLMESRCYRESQDKLSCVTCHNPHIDAVTNVRSYEPVCLGCHSGAPATAKTVHAKVCPVNSREHCIACHMPSRPVFKNGKLPVEMAEHTIRVYRK